jgi:hypothetical protein
MGREYRAVKLDWWRGDVMPWSAGLFTRTDGTRTGTTVWQQAKAALIGILASSHDAHDQDLATGINQCLTKDGSNALTGNLNAASNKITSLATGTVGTDAATTAQVTAAQAASQPVSAVLTSLSSRSGVPTTVGMVSKFVGSTPPSGWLKANGALVSRTTYADLWAYAQACGSLETDATWASSKLYGDFSMGDGSTTFRLPDLRQCFSVGWADDKTGGVDDSRVIGSFQSQAILAHTHTGTTGDQSADHTHSTVASSGWSNDGAGTAKLVQQGSGTTGGASTGHTHSFTSASTGGTRCVPNNVAMMYCISYL